MLSIILSSINSKSKLERAFNNLLSPELSMNLFPEELATTQRNQKSEVGSTNLPSKKSKLWKKFWTRMGLTAKNSAGLNYQMRPSLIYLERTGIGGLFNEHCIKRIGTNI